MKKISAFVLVVVMIFTMSSCGAEALGRSDDNTMDMEVVSMSGTEQTNKYEENSSIQADFVTPPENFVLISGGTFKMGSPDTENWRSDDETQHVVTLNDFYMSKYEVTQTEFEKVMGNNPSSFSGDNLPVEMVSWFDAIRYCNVQSEKERADTCV